MKIAPPHPNTTDFGVTLSVSVSHFEVWVWACVDSPYTVYAVMLVTFITFCICICVSFVCLFACY